MAASTIAVGNTSPRLPDATRVGLSLYSVEEFLAALIDFSFHPRFNLYRFVHCGGYFLHWICKTARRIRGTLRGAMTIVVGAQKSLLREQLPMSCQI
jgi:hypothetical protein